LKLTGRNSSTVGNTGREQNVKAGTTARKTIEVIDLVNYSDIVRTLEENLGSGAVAELNDQIQRFIVDSINAFGKSDDCILKTTGDGAILQFDSVELAHSVAERIHRASANYNKKRTEFIAKRYFKIGIATGDVTYQVLPGGQLDFAGLAVSNAVRLESACAPGQILMDPESFGLLPLSCQGAYGPEELVRGKRTETFRAHRYSVIKDVDAASRQVSQASDAGSSDHRVLIEQLRQLGNGLDELSILIEMPVHERPATTLSDQQRYLVVITWAQRVGKLEKLRTELAYLLKKK